MTNRSRRLYSQLLCGAAMATVLGASTAVRAEESNFTIPPQSLASALASFSEQAGRPVLYRPEIATAKSSPGASGSLETEVALNQLLAGTGLTFQQDGATFLIVSASDPQSGSAAGAGADAGTVQALIVTAQKREENIQDVPIAMSAFTQESLTRSQVAGGPDLMTQVPNMTFTKTNFSGYSIQIRGIGTQAISSTTDPAVAVAFNNTPFIRNRFFEQEFFDLERVEVLRGPQGTLYGRNATAGVVNIISAKPNSHRFEAKLSGDVGNYNSTRLEGMINIPLVEDKAALRIAGAWTKRDGFVKNLLTGRQTDGRDLWSTRVTLGLTPTDNFKANLIWEHFEENDDRLRSGKQLCRKDLGPTEVGGLAVMQTADALIPTAASVWSQGCKPASLYSPDSFQTPNGYALPYYGPAAGIGSPVYLALDPYLHATQSRNLREIETHIVPEYQAATDTVELQISEELSHNLTLTSETGYLRDHLFSFEDYNRFDTTPGVFVPGTNLDPSAHQEVDQNGVFCDPQLGCTNRLAAGDLSTAASRQFSQEFRLSSNFEGKFNFSAGANFLRYDTEDKYYVFINSLTAFTGASQPWIPGVTDNSQYFEHLDPCGACQGTYLRGFVWSDPYASYGTGVTYIDPNNIHNLNDEGRNYFLSRNPYRLISYAAFGQVYYQITPDLKFTGGLRWTVDNKNAPQIPSWLLAGSSYGNPTRKTIRQTWREPTGRAAIDWNPTLSFTDETLVYGSYVRGYKAGGANPPPATVIGTQVKLPFDAVSRAFLTHPETFKPEFVNAYEVGTKNTLLDGRLTFNLNAFYYDYTGYQISEIVDRSAVNLNFDAKIWGSELEVEWRPLENLRLGFKGGYENTQVAKGQSAIDLMDRTAGDPNFLVARPFPTIPSNCIVPAASAPYGRSCIDYYVGTYTDVPNNGEGVAKDLSGNALPNAPKFTSTITADYTLPLPSDWLMTLHTDLYYQSEAWTRIFNDPGYDKLKAYNNINVAAIFTNEDAGWTVMAYVKNVLNKDNITGAFLNSDDTGLTTNVFLNEPRLFGIRVTRAWTDSAWWAPQLHTGADAPFRLEVDGAYGHMTGDHQVFAPAMVSNFPAAHPYPLGVQNNLDWGSAGGIKLTYRPDPHGWSISAGVRYGRANGSAEAHPKWAIAGGYKSHKYHHKNYVGYVDPTAQQYFNYATTTASNEEAFAIADFMVGKDVGLGGLSAGNSNLNLGLRYAHFKSRNDAVLRGRPDFYFPPDDIIKYGGHAHKFKGVLDASHEFEGAGPAAGWETTFALTGSPQATGGVGLDVGLGGALLWGRQKTTIHGSENGEYAIGIFQVPIFGGFKVIDSYSTPLAQTRTKRVTVPGVNANLGLSYTLGGLKVSGGYRVERYFDAIDGGIATRKTYDRQYDGPYFKVSVGFGG